MTAAERLAERVGGAAVVLIDGHSGSGKTTLAAGLADAVERASGARPAVIGMDELYPGWDGLAAGSAALAGALAAGEYERYDWLLGEFSERVGIPADGTLIVEGCGALTAASLAAAAARGRVYAVWVESPEGLRRERALARDGDMFAPHWDAWAAQERAHFASARPLALANETVHTEAVSPA